MKARIVDDEEHVVEAVRLLVPWSELGISEVFAASSVPEAQALIRTLRPEIAILDVMIGNDTGIHLAQFITDEAPATKIISISGHSDFDCVRGMFVYGCIDYLLKPIEEDKIITALQKAVSAVQNEEENSRLNGVEASKVKEISRQHQQMLLSELLQHGNISPIYAELCQSDATLAKAQYCMVLVCDLFFWPVQDTAFSDRLNVAAKKISHQLEEWNCGVLLYHTQTMGQIVILLYSEFSDAQRMIVQILEELSVSHGLYVGCSGCNPFPDALTQSYAEAQQAFLSAGPSHGRTLLVRYSAETPRVKVKTSIELENQMLSALLIGDNAAISNAVHHWIQFASGERPMTLGLLKDLWFYFDKLYHRWVEYLYNRYTSFSPVSPLNGPFPLSLTNDAWCNIKESLTAFFCSVLEHIHQEIYTVRKSGDLMYEIADYLELNYKEPFDQCRYSDLFHINKDYLSRKFKETFGSGMVAYLTNIRIKHAKELLVSSDMQVQEIAIAVGFQDEGYFTKQFKKIVSMTPAAYRIWRLQSNDQKAGPKES